MTEQVCISETELEEVRGMCKVPCFTVSGMNSANLEEALFFVIEAAYNHSLKHTKATNVSLAKDKDSKDDCKC